MQRLTKFMKHEIGDVSDVVDRPLADGFEFLHQPIRRRSNLDSAHDARRISRTQIGIANFNRTELAGLVARVFDLELWTLDFGLFYNRQLTRDADVRQTIAAI